MFQGTVRFFFCGYSTTWIVFFQQRTSPLRLLALEPFRLIPGFIDRELSADIGAWEE
jgi:hypothetical protein